MRIVELSIKNWEKHNPRSDVKTARWFKMSNEFFNDPEFYCLSLEAHQVWIYFLCSASKKGEGKIKINTQMIADNLRVSVDSIDFAIIELEKSGSIVTNPVTLVSEELASDRKDKVTIQVRALEEKRREEIREEEKREENTCTELVVDDSMLKKNLPKVQSQEKLKGPIPEFSNNPVYSGLFITVLQDTQFLWLQTYQDLPWLSSEFIKMVNWLKVNPRKAPKSRLDRFIGSWLGRSWDDHRKTLPGQFSKQSHRVQSGLSIEELEEARALGII